MKSATWACFDKLPSVPPCSDMVIEEETLSYQKWCTGSGEVTFFDPLEKSQLLLYRKFDATPRQVLVDALEFTDRDGTVWSRRDGRLDQGKLHLAGHGVGWQGAVYGDPTVHPVESWGGDAADRNAKHSDTQRNECAPALGSTHSLRITSRHCAWTRGS